MNTAILNIKTDPETKRQLQAFAVEVGVPVSVIINAQIKQTLRNCSIELSTEPMPKQSVINEVIDAVTDYRVGKNVSKAYTTPAQVRKHLQAL